MATAYALILFAAIVAALVLCWRYPRRAADAPPRCLSPRVLALVLAFAAAFPFLLAAWQSADNEMRKLHRVESLFPGGAQRMHDQALAAREAEEERRAAAIAATVPLHGQP